jgi:peptide alpha-N-acetyltransferase
MCCAHSKVVLEAELSNMPAIRLYERLGFIRDKSLFRYYLRGSNAVRLKLWLK